MASSSSTPPGARSRWRKSRRSRSRLGRSPGSTSTIRKPPRLAAGLKKSARGEYEITDLNKAYLESGALSVRRLGRGFAWLDTGTPESLLQAAQYVHAVEQRQGQRIACLEEIAFQQGWIGVEDIRRAAAQLSKNGYGAYLAALADERAAR